MTTLTNPLRLQQRAPQYDSEQHGDSVRWGFERAIDEATMRARETGRRQLVTCSRYAPGAFRVQAWR